MDQPPVLRILGGFFFILAGVFAYYRFAIGLSLPIIFVGAGAAVLLIAVVGRRARVSGGDVTIFVIGLLVLGGVASSLAVGGDQTVVYSATREQVHAGRLVLNVSSGFGSVDISFSDRGDLAYQINFTRSVPFFPFGAGPPSLSNRTAGGALFLDAKSGGEDAVVVTLGEGYVTDLTVSAAAGSVGIQTLGQEHLGDVSISTGAGSIDANFTVASIGGLDMSTGSGSISLNSANLAPESSRVPVSLSSGAGSVSIDIAVPRSYGVSISASSGLGTISQNLPGFVVTTSPGNLNATAGGTTGSNRSLEISLSTGVGTLSVNGRLT